MKFGAHKFFTRQKMAEEGWKIAEEGVENRSVVRGWSSGVFHQANMASECGRYDRHG